MEAYLAALAPLLLNNGFEVGFVSQYKPIGSLSNWIQVNGPMWHLDRTDVESVLLAVRDWSPDVVFSHGMGNPEFENRISTHFKVVYLNHNYGGVCASGTKMHFMPWPRHCPWPLGPRCVAGWMPMLCDGFNPLRFIRALKREKYRQELFHKAHTICVASMHMRSVMIQNGVPEEKVRLLPLFPTHGEPDQSPPVPRPQTDKVLLAGRLTRLKGWTHLVPAIARASETLGRRLSLVVAGDGPDRLRLAGLARKWDLPLEDHGWQASAGVTRLMRDADLLAVPSLWPEPFGLVGIEAGCVGTPAVAYAVGGIPDWLVPGVSGEMAPGDALKSRPLADAIVRALRDPGHWQQLREGAWRQAVRFSRKKHMEDLLNILHGAAG